MEGLGKRYCGLWNNTGIQIVTVKSQNPKISDVAWDLCTVLNYDTQIKWSQSDVCVLNDSYANVTHTNGTVFQLDGTNETNQSVIFDKTTEEGSNYTVTLFVNDSVGNSYIYDFQFDVREVCGTAKTEEMVTFCEPGDI